MSLFKPNYEWMKADSFRSEKNKRRNRKDGKPKGDRQHWSVNERRIVAIQEEGMIAHSNGVPREKNPKISDQSRMAWFQGWDAAEQGEKL
jgi:hypothetical protein